MGIKIIGSGMYVPELTISNDDMAKIVETSDEWIYKRTGIKYRHFTEGELNFQLGAKAAKEALRNAGIRPDDIDLVLGTTMSPDCLTPTMSSMVARELHINHAPCMDLNAACSGFVYALETARNYLNSEEYKNILIVSSEVLSRTLNFKDRSTCVLFGDGAAAVVVTRGEGMYASYLGGDAMKANKLYAKLPTPKHPFWSGAYDWGEEEMNESDSSGIFMDGEEIFRYAATVLPNAVDRVAKKAGISMEEISMLIPHQANVRILMAANKKLKLAPEKLYLGLEEYGNISSACIPMGIHKLMMEGRLKAGDKVCVVGFGAGLTFGAVLFEWEN